MQRHSFSTILGRPALHLLLALAFAVAFCWPILAMTRPAHTFHFLYTSWIISLAALFAVSRGASAEGSDAPNEPPEAADDAEEGTREFTRESL